MALGSLVSPPQKNALGVLLYLADNLAYLPYNTLEEPLFVVHHVDLTISVTGSSLLQQFKEVCMCVFTVSPNRWEGGKAKHMTTSKEPFQWPHQKGFSDGLSYSTSQKGKETRGKCHYPASVPSRP